MELLFEFCAVGLLLLVFLSLRYFTGFLFVNVPSVLVPVTRNKSYKFPSEKQQKQKKTFIYEKKYHENS